MTLGLLPIKSAKLGELKVPIFGAPYVANDTVSPFLVNSPYGAELISIRSNFGNVGTTDPPWANLFLSSLSPAKRFDLILNGAGVANIDNQGTAFIGPIFATSLNDNRTGSFKNTAAFANFNSIGSGNTTLNQQPTTYDVSQVSGGFANPDNLPFFVMVEISVSPPTYVPAVYFSASGNDVIDNVYMSVLYHGQILGPPTQAYLGPSIPGGGTFGGVITIPETFILDVNKGLAYSDTALHSASIAGQLPDQANKTNRKILFDGTIWRILTWIPGEFPIGSAVYNQNGIDSHITLDDATLNTAFQNSGTNLMQAWYKGFLMKIRTTYKGQTPALILLTPDGSGYYVIFMEPQDATAVDALSTGVDTKFALGVDGTLYVNKFNSTVIATSFGTNPFPLFVPQLQPIELPCFEPCLPWPVSLPGGLA